MSTIANKAAVVTDRRRSPDATSTGTEAQDRSGSVFRSVLVSKVINKVLWKGKKNTAREIVYENLEVVEQRTSQDPSVILKRAVDNVRPQVEVRSRRVGGSSYQVPVEVSARRQETLAIRWLVNFARQRREETTMAMRLANEILDASNYTGARSSARKMFTRWRSPTRHSPTTAGNPRNVPVGGSRHRNRPEPQDVGRSQPHIESE